MPVPKPRWLCSIWLLALCGCAPPDRPAPADAVALYAAVSHNYELDGRRIEAAAWDDATLNRLVSSRDPGVRRVARTAVQCKWLHARVPQFGGKPPPRIGREEAVRFQRLVFGQALSAIADPDAEGDWRAAGKALEAFAGGPHAHDAINYTMHLELLECGLGVSFRSQLRDLAAQRSRPTVPPAGVRVLMDTQRPGLIMIKNQTKSPWHHCLILTRLQADVARVRKDAQQEDFASVFLQGAFSPEFVEGSRTTARLHYLKDELDKGQVAYLAEIPPGSQVTAGFAGLVSFTRSTNAEISLWCDEFSVEHLTAANWAKVKADTKPKLRGTPVPPYPWPVPRVPVFPPVLPSGAKRPRLGDGPPVPNPPDTHPRRPVGSSGPGRPPRGPFGGFYRGAPRRPRGPIERRGGFHETPPVIPRDQGRGHRVFGPK